MTIQRCVPLIIILCLLLAVPTSAAPAAGQSDAPHAAIATDGIDFVQRLGGRYSHIHVLGSTAYLIGAGQLVKVDIANPAAPVITAQMFLPLDGEFVFAGAYLYVAQRGGILWIIDLQNLAEPTVVGTFPADQQPQEWQAMDVQVQGQRAYLLTSTRDAQARTLRILDIADPAQPEQLGALDLGRPSYIQNDQFVVAGGYAYVSFDGNKAGVYAIDVANPAAPAIVNTYVTDGGALAYALLVESQRVYFQYTGSGKYLLDIISIANPAQPAKLSTFDLGATPKKLMAVDGVYVYIVDAWLSGTHSIMVYDFTSPAAPAVHTNMYLDGLDVMALVARDHRVTLLLADPRQTFLSIRDLSQPFTPREIGRLALGSKQASTLRIKGDSLYANANGELQRYSLADPLAPVLVARIPGMNPRNLVVGDDYAYADGFTVIDLQTMQASQVTVWSGNSPVGAHPIGLEGRRVYSMDQPSGGTTIHVLDFTTITAPTLLGSYDNQSAINQPVMSGGVAWFISEITRDRCALRGVDLSDPVNPRLIANIQLPATLFCLYFHQTFRWLAVGNDVLYIADSLTLRAFDISDPSHPVELAARSFDTYITALNADAGSVYVNNRDGVTIVDHSVPSRLIPLGTLQLGNPDGDFTGTVVARDGVIYRSGYGITVLRSRMMLARGVVRQINGLPFAGASIAASTGASQPVGADGMFRFQDLPRGPVTFTPSRPGYAFWPPVRTADLPLDARLYFQVTAPPLAAALPAGTQRSLAFTDTQGLPTSFILDTTALSLTSSVAITPTPSPATMIGSAFAGHAFALAVDPAVAVTATIRYSAADLRVASDPAALALWRWTGAAWEPACAAPAHDPAARTFTVALCQPGAYALFAPTHQLILPWIPAE